VTKSLVGLIRQDGPRVERNGFLVGTGAVFSMQIERIIRESGAPGRRTFRTPHELGAWLGELLTPTERSRLDTFLRENARQRGEPEH